MTFRPGPLRAAAILAAAFVGARVVYRVLFHGADGGGVVLLSLPEVRLPAPFAHVVLLGPVTTEGLWDAAASAIPIALAILAFGAVNAVVDLHRVFARASRRGPLRGVARALAIAGATLPSLADGARAVRFAQRLRGERGGARMLLPLLQRTLERAGAVAAALELRGFAGRGLDGDCLRPVDAHDVVIGWGDASADADGDGGRAMGRGIRLPLLELAPGTLTVVAGATGSGKSTLLRAIAGLHSHTDGGWITGSLRVVGHDRTAVPPRDLAQRVGVVLQNPREAFATERVRDEVGLALELRGVARVIVAARVAEVAGQVGIADLLDRPTRGLSAGEATLVAIAAAIVERPILLLVDEPLADLDAAARSRIVALLAALAHEAGLCVVVAEHRVEALGGVADDVWRIADGAVEASPFSLDAVPSPARESAATPERSPGADPGQPTLRARAITVSHGDTIAVSGADLDLHAGEIVALVGPNGAGKSSLLSALALPARGADVSAMGRVALIPDASDDLFVYDTVAAECLRADRRAAKGAARHAHRRPGEEPGEEPSARRSATRFAGFLGLGPGDPEFAALLGRHPRDLSAGERRCLALAIQLAGDPAVLLVDEPTRGLDPGARATVWAALTSLAASGTAVLVASHEPDVTAAADRMLRMRAGRLVHEDSLFAIQDERTTAGREPRNSAGFAAAAANGPELRTPRGAPSASGGDARPGMPESQASVVPAPGVEPASARPRPRSHRTGRRVAVLGRAVANLVALAAFCWPFVATALPSQAQAAVPVAALALVPLAALVVVAALDGTVRSAHLLALLGTLAAIGAAVRIASTGVGGVEAVFILLILAGRAFGVRFGLLLGMATIALSTLITGTFGPWTPFQMFACAWVAAGAALLPRRVSPGAEIAMLCVYGVVASYTFGLLMNLWFWPFAVGYGTGISYDGAAPIGVNLTSFLLYSLVTSTLSWDTLRAITTVIGLIAIGRPVLAALRRAKPLAPRRPTQLPMWNVPTRVTPSDSKTGMSQPAG